MNMRIGFRFAAILAVFSVGAFAQAPVKKPACDRACLEGFMNRYLTAMLNREVKDDLFARNVRFTENGIQLPLGDEGLWYGMSGLGGYRFYVPDIETQQVALIGTVKENMGNHGVNNDQGNNVAVAIRLKIENTKITEVEQLAIRPAVQLGGPGRGAGAGAAKGKGAPPPAPAAAPAPAAQTTGDRVAQMTKPHDVYFQVIPENERMSREDLVIAANYYFTALARHDSKGYYPFTEGCVRFENGMTSTNDCLANFTGTSLNNIVDRIRDRRFVAVDRERGIAFAFAFFDHYRINWTWQLAELFKIEKGKIRRIEAVFHQAPFGIPSGWSTYERSISEEIQSIR
jgi:hypothetical protein